MVSSFVGVASAASNVARGTTPSSFPSASVTARGTLLRPTSEQMSLSGVSASTALYSLVVSWPSAGALLAHGRGQQVRAGDADDPAVGVQDVGAHALDVAQPAQHVLGIVAAPWR